MIHKFKQPNSISLGTFCSPESAKLNLQINNPTSKLNHWRPRQAMTTISAVDLQGRVEIKLLLVKEREVHSLVLCNY